MIALITLNNPDNPDNCDPRYSEDDDAGWDDMEFENDPNSPAANEYSFSNSDNYRPRSAHHKVISRLSGLSGLPGLFVQPYNQFFLFLF